MVLRNTGADRLASPVVSLGKWDKKSWQKLPVFGIFKIDFFSENFCQKRKKTRSFAWRKGQKILVKLPLFGILKINFLAEVFIKKEEKSCSFARQMGQKSWQNRRFLAFLKLIF